MDLKVGPSDIYMKPAGSDGKLGIWINGVWFEYCAADSPDSEGPKYAKPHVGQRCASARQETEGGAPDWLGEEVESRGSLGEVPKGARVEACVCP